MRAGSPLLPVVDAHRGRWRLLLRTRLRDRRTSGSRAARSRRAAARAPGYCSRRQDRSSPARIDRPVTSPRPGGVVERYPPRSGGVAVQHSDPSARYPRRRSRARARQRQPSRIPRTDRARRLRAARCTEPTVGRPREAWILPRGGIVGLGAAPCVAGLVATRTRAVFADHWSPRGSASRMSPGGREDTRIRSFVLYDALLLTLPEFADVHPSRMGTRPASRETAVGAPTPPPRGRHGAPRRVEQLLHVAAHDVPRDEPASRPDSSRRVSSSV